MTIAGKTGTANKSNSNENEKLMSFCGFFPADKPEYTLIVQMHYDVALDTRSAQEREDNSYGGGSTSAIAFKGIAEKIMSKKMTDNLENAVNKKDTLAPKIMTGNIAEASYVLKSLGFERTEELEFATDTLWGEIKSDKSGKLHYDAKHFKDNVIPDVKGMGAKDAIFLLQGYGLKVKVEGYGKVIGQNEISKDTIRLTLENKE
jgi:cell division protein FtsI (penicillin-binding protein 3)